MIPPFQGSGNRAIIAILCLLCVALTSCKSALLDPFRPTDFVRLTDANSAMTLMNHRVRPATTVTGKRSLTLADCRALALGNNLDLQVARMEELTKRAIRYSNQMRLLPHFIFSGDLSQRDSYPYSFSAPLGEDPRTAAPGGNQGAVSNYSVGHLRDTWRYVLEARWSPTDAALAYFVTKSSANDTVRARCQRIRITQKLFEIVDSSYWRLLAHQEALPLAERLVSLRSGIQHKSGQLLDERLVRTEVYQRAEQKAIRARRLLSKIRNDIESDRNILASALALSPYGASDGGLQVVGTLIKPQCDMPMAAMEMTAVRTRPETYDAGLAHLSSVEDLKRTIVKYFPRVTGFWRHTRDNNRFLLYREWEEVGLSIYFDLGDWLANVQESKASWLKADGSAKQMGAVALGITSQVRLAALKYFDSMDELQSTDMSVKSLGRVLGSVEARLSMHDVERLAVDEARGDLLEAKLNRLRALGEANAQVAALQSSMGTNYTEPMSH